MAGHLIYAWWLHCQQLIMELLLLVRVVTLHNMMTYCTTAQWRLGHNSIKTVLYREAARAGHTVRLILTWFDKSKRRPQSIFISVPCRDQVIDVVEEPPMEPPLDDLPLGQVLPCEDNR